MTKTETGAAVPYELTEALVTIGRAAENTIVLADPSVSGRHAQLQRAGDDYQLVDLESTNGTRVNGESIRSVLLQPGDRIRFGKLEACFECELSATAQPLPVLEAVEASPAEVSTRPVDFENASPFPKRTSQKDRARLALYAAAAVAILLFLASMLALAQMHSPLP
ncbi:MAG: FHA domain-containing protein [Verrucomicrobiota bacterium]|nr:FHA domain-containing protein [Verrucomicrobiota bacterium]